MIALGMVIVLRVLAGQHHSVVMVWSWRTAGHRDRRRRFQWRAKQHCR
jgi:hypothetical protein